MTFGGHGRRDAGEESAGPRVSEPPRKAAPTIECGRRVPMDCVREWFASEGWGAVPIPGGGLAGLPGRRKRADSRGYGHGKDLCRLDGPISSGCGIIRRVREAAERWDGGSATTSRFVGYAAARFGRRHRGRSSGADRRPGPSLDRRVPHGRHRARECGPGRASAFLPPW